MAAVRGRIEDHVRRPSLNAALQNATPQHERIGYLSWLGGERKAAYEAFQAAARPNGPKSFSISPAFPLILFAQEMRNEKLRDELLDELGKVKNNSYSELVSLYSMYRQQLLNGKLERLDSNAVDSLIDGAKPANRGAIAFFAAGILDLQGDRDRAKAYYRRCAKIPECDPWMQVIAVDTVRAWVRSDPNATPDDRMDSRE